MEIEKMQEQFGIIGQSVEMKEIMSVVQQVSPTDITVLITGESGTGKEVIAKAIHQMSTRAQKAMISVNAGAIPEGIIESELFGHEKGAFTSASETRKGYFDLADGGTIFLDEIGELPIGTQVKFLRVLENGEYMRVGSANPRKVNVRIIAATNKDLESEVQRGSFRADLFFRLRSINVRIPPLRERREDIPLFVNEFTKQIAEKNNISFAGISDEALRILQDYHWLGNVRELRNVVESMLIIERGKRIDESNVRKHLKEFHNNGRNLPVYTRKTPEQAERELIYRALLEVKNDVMDLKQLLLNRRPVGETVQLEQPYVAVEEQHATNENQSQIPSLEEVEKKVIINALERYEGNRRLAAKALRISERTLYRKIKEYNMNL